MTSIARGDVTASGNGHGMSAGVEALRCIGSGVLAAFKQFRAVGADAIPVSGPVILVANHTTSYDPVCLQVACKHRPIRFMQAREYYEMKPLYFLYRQLDVIPVNRTGNDTASIRTALRTLSDGGCLGLFPEGKMSEDGQLQEGHKGVALLALMSNAPVVPAYIHGTRPFRGILRDFMQFNQVTLYFGPPIRFDDLAGRHRQREVLDAALKRTMDGIAALHDRYATG